jgi:hypothetical protein
MFPFETQGVCQKINAYLSAFWSGRNNHFKENKFILLNKRDTYNC